MGDKSWPTWIPWHVIAFPNDHWSSSQYKRRKTTLHSLDGVKKKELAPLKGWFVHLHTSGWEALDGPLTMAAHECYVGLRLPTTDGFYARRHNWSLRMFSHPSASINQQQGLVCWEAHFVPVLCLHSPEGRQGSPTKCHCWACGWLNGSFITMPSWHLTLTATPPVYFWTLTTDGYSSCDHAQNIKERIIILF